MKYELFAWVDEQDGVCTIATALGLTLAVFPTRRLAESPLILDQIQTRATAQDRSMRLERYVDSESVRIIRPWEST